MNTRRALLQPLRMRRDYGEPDPREDELEELHDHLGHCAQDMFFRGIPRAKVAAAHIAKAMRDIRDAMRIAVARTAEDAIQTIIVSKDHPGVDSRADAQRIAEKHGDVYTSRETESSYRFRQRPPGDFVEDSMRTEKRGEHVSVVWGELKRGKSKKGARWESLPRGWTDESRKKFWDSLTSGTTPERVKECISKIGDNVSDPGAFCASLADRLSPGWRQKTRR